MKKLKICLAALLATSMLLSSCGGGTAATPPSPSASTPASESPATSETPATSQAPTGNLPDKDIVVGVNANFITLDPHVSRAALDNSAIGYMVEPLVRYSEALEIEPVLAESYTISDDNLVYTFKLKEGVKFHDGTDFNAEAVKANFDRVMDPNESYRPKRNLTMLTEWNVLDDNTIEFVLSEPYMVFLDKLTAVRLVSPKAIEEYGKDGLPKHPVGTGLYVLEDWNEGEYLKMNRNPDHRDADKIQIDSITYKFILENSTRVAMLQAGEADYIYPMPNEQVEVLKNDPNIEIGVASSTICRYVSMNQNVGPLAIKEVRQAMNHAIDKDAYIKVVKGGYAIPLNSSMSPQLSYHVDHDLYEYDVDKAKQMLADAGYPDGFEITLWGSNDTETVKGMNFIEQQLAQVGITVNLVPMEEGILSAKVYETTPETTEIQMWYVSWSSVDVDNATRSTFNSNYFPPNGANTGYYNNPDLDRLMNEANKLTDPVQIKEKYGEIQDMIWDDAVWLFLGVDEVVYAKNVHLKGMRIDTTGGMYFREASVE